MRGNTDLYHGVDIKCVICSKIDVGLLFAGAGWVHETYTGASIHNVSDVHCGGVVFDQMRLRS